jgi:AcrR family transcriptional regulator
MNNTSKDIRYAQTEEDLLTAFDLLCREKDPAKITVAEISKKTGVTRSTFYNHYQDVLQLIETLENRILNDLRGVLVMLQPGYEQPEKLTRTYFSALCRYVKKSGFLIRQLKTLEGAEFVGRAMSLLHEYVREFADSETTETPARVQFQSYLLSYTIGGLFGILHKWASEECNDSPEAVASLLTRFYLNGVSSFIVF